MGTTLETLQAYPLGTLEVEYYTSAYGGTTLRDTVIGLWGPTGRVMLSKASDMRADELTPVLRPFSALCTPLEDGTIPANGLAMELTGCANWQRIEDYIDFYDEDGVRVYELCEDWMWLHFYSRHNRDFTEQFSPPLDVAKWLYAKHFAVGLTPEQFIPKI